MKCITVYDVTVMNCMFCQKHSKGIRLTKLAINFMQISSYQTTVNHPMTEHTLGSHKSTATKKCNLGSKALLIFINWQNSPQHVFYNHLGSFLNSRYKFPAIYYNTWLQIFSISNARFIQNITILLSSSTMILQQNILQQKNFGYSWALFKKYS